MNVLVAGSSGLIGSALIARLISDGHDVVRMVRRPASGPSGVVWDPATSTIDKEVLERSGPFDGVVNLAGSPIGDHRWTTSERSRILESRTTSTDLLATVMAGLDRPPPVLVNASAIGFYGDRGSEELTEDAGSGTGFLAGVCAAWERSASAAADAGIRTVLLRTGIVLDAGGGALARQLPLFRVGLGGRLGPGSQYVSWITLDDEVGAIIHCLTTPELTGPVNAVGPSAVTNAELTAALGRVLHRPTIVPVPSLALRAALGRRRADELVLCSQRVVPARLTESGYRFTASTVDAALEAVLRR